MKTLPIIRLCFPLLLHNVSSHYLQEPYWFELRHPDQPKYASKIALNTVDVKRLALPHDIQGRPDLLELLLLGRINCIFTSRQVPADSEDSDVIDHSELREDDLFFSLSSTHEHRPSIYSRPPKIEYSTTLLFHLETSGLRMIGENGLALPYYQFELPLSQKQFRRIRWLSRQAPNTVFTLSLDLP